MHDDLHEDPHDDLHDDRPDETGAAPFASGIALDVALAWFDAWTHQDMDRATTFLAADVVCDAPAGRLEGVGALRAFMEPFAGTVTGVRVLAAAGDASDAVLVYDTSTRLVASAPAAEVTHVVDGRIVRLRIVFDRLPFEQARAAARAAQRGAEGDAPRTSR